MEHGNATDDYFCENPHENMNDERLVLSNTLYQVVGKVITASLGMVMMFFMTRHIGVSAFGEYNYVLAFVGMGYIVADLGLEPVLVRSRAEGTITRDEFNSLVWFRALILALVLVGSLCVSRYVLQYDMRLVTGILIAGCAHSFLMLTSMIWALLKGDLSYRAIVTTQVMTSIVHCVAVLLAVWLAWPLVGFYSVFLFGYAAGFVATTRYNPFELRMRLDFPDVKKYVLLAMPFMVGSMVSIAGSRVHVLMLGSLFSPSQYPFVGYFTFALRIYDVITLLGGYYSQTIFPYFARMSFAERSEKFGRYCIYSIALGSLLGATMWLGAYPLVHFLGGGGFEPAVEVVRILSFAAGITILEGFLYSYLFAMEKEKVWATLATVSVSVHVLLNSIFVPMYSYIGASWIMVAVHAFSCVMTGGVIYYGMRKQHA